jgi:chromosome segregation ATPase
MYNNLKYDFDELDVNHNTTLIKLQDLQRQYENLTNKTATLSDRLNDIEFKNGNLTRDLETAKDIAESKAINNKKLVDKLVNDLKTVDARWEKIMNENTMVCEDFR